MRLWQSAFALVAVAAACSLADYDVAETFTPSADSYVRMSNDPDAGATPLAVAVVPGPALRAPVMVSLSGADGVVCPPIQLDPADASVWSGALMLSAAADAGVQPMLWDASVHFESSGFQADLPVMIREGSAVAIVTPGSCGLGGAPIVASTCHVIVPPDAKNGLVVWAIGGGGGGGIGTSSQNCTNAPAKGGNGGPGGYILAQVSVAPGADLLAIAGAGGREGQPVAAGGTYGSGGGGGGLSGVFDGADAGPLVVAGGGGGGGAGACPNSSPIDGNSGGGGSGDVGMNGLGSSGGGGGGSSTPGANGFVCDSITLRTAGYLLGGGCDPNTATFVCASGGTPGGGGGYGVSQSLSGGGGGGAGFFGGGVGGSQCNSTPSSGGGGGSGHASALALVTDAGVSLLTGTVDAGPGSGGPGGTKNPEAGLGGFVYITLP